MLREPQHGNLLPKDPATIELQLDFLFWFWLLYFYLTIVASHTSRFCFYGSNKKQIIIKMRILEIYYFVTNCILYLL